MARVRKTMEQLSSAVMHPWITKLIEQPALPALLEEKLPDVSNPWAISPDTARLLAGLVLMRRPKHVLEFGAGASSLMLAHALTHVGGGCLTAVEQSPQWCAQQWREVERLSAVDTAMIVGRPRLVIDRRGAYQGFPDAASSLADRGPFDLVLIDAPQHYYGRDGSLHIALQHLSPGALIVLDDATRAGERATIRRWQDLYPGLSLVFMSPEHGRNGLAVFEFSGDPAVRPHPAIVLSSAIAAVRNWNRRRRKKLGEFHPESVA